MIKFRQKEFIAPLLAAGGRLVAGALPEMAVSGAIGIAGNKMQSKANEQQKEIMEQQAREQKRQNEKIAEAMNKIAENSKNNPQSAAQEAGNLLEQKQFARINLNSFKNNETVKNAVGLGKDLGKVVWKGRRNLIGGVLSGAALSGASYLTDKAIQHDMKKSGIPLPPKKEQREYSFKKESIMKGLKFAGKEILQSAKNNKIMIGSMAALGSVPTALGYAAEKKELKDQVNRTTPPREKTYSLMSSIGKMRKKIEAAPIFHTPGQTILGGISNMFGGGGRKGVYKFGHQLNRYGKHSGSKWSQKAGQFIMNNPKTALIGSIPVGMGVMASTWDLGDKLIRKGAKKFDKNAYAYQESKEEEIPE